MSWQSVNVQAAASYLRERIAAGDDSARTKAIYDGLLEVLDPTRRAVRVQREMAAGAKAAAAAAVQAERDRRAAERRRQDRRRAAPPASSAAEASAGPARTGATAASRRRVYRPGKYDGSARSRIVWRPGVAFNTFGIELTTMDAVPTSP